jgi:hypothetical protein
VLSPHHAQKKPAVTREDHRVHLGDCVLYLEPGFSRCRGGIPLPTKGLEVYSATLDLYASVGGHRANGGSPRAEIYSKFTSDFSLHRYREVYA